MEIQFENLLDKGGWAFYAESIGQAGNWKKVTGTILLTPDKTSKVQLVFGDHGGPVEWGVLNGTPENLITFSVYGFRLLEPESKEPTVSKEEAEKRPTWPDVFSFEETPEKKIRRETATQIFCSFINGSLRSNEAEHTMDYSITLTDLLLKKLGE